MITNLISIIGVLVLFQIRIKQPCLNFTKRFIFIYLFNILKEKLNIFQDSKDSSVSNFFDTVRMSLADKVTFNLLTERDFRVNNTIDSTDPSSTIMDIRKYILETASNQSYWGKQIPAKWCNLENILMKLRIKGTKVLFVILSVEVYMAILLK